MSNDSIVLFDAAGRRRSPATRPGYLAGRAPHNKGMQYPPDPPWAEEIILVMRQAGQDRHGLRIRALIAVLWRGDLRISEALALNETDVDPHRGSLMIRHGLCRIRRWPCYAGALVMPSRACRSGVCLLRACWDARQVRHNFRRSCQRLSRNARGRRWRGSVRVGCLAVRCGRSLVV